MADIRDIAERQKRLDIASMWVKHCDAILGSIRKCEKVYVHALIQPLIRVDNNTRFHFDYPNDKFETPQI